MYEIELTVKFKKDLKRVKKRGLNISLLDEVITQSVISGTLPPKFKPHKLKG
jgi:mRNA interferase YafQ